jgi:tetratricopeptide (TPR) repeat protein
MRSRGQIVGISGEAGIGKSRLIFEFRESLVERPLTYVEGQCRSYGLTIPYLPVLDVFRALCGITDGDTVGEVADKARTSLLEAGLDLLETAPYFLHLLDVADDIERFAALTPEVTKTRIFETLRQLIVKTSRHTPLIIVIEDLHWIDSTSEEYLASLAEILPGVPVLLVCTYRLGYRAPWREKSYMTQVALQPLAPEESLHIVRSVLAEDPAVDAFHELIVAKAEGNPFFVEELARTVREQVGLRMPMAVPDTIEEVLGTRIDRLAAEDRRVLEVAAVVGKDVPFSVAQAVAGFPEPELRRSFERLKAAEFLYETGPGPETEYTFKHTLTHEVAYGRLLEEPRRALHARIAQAIERLYEDRLAEQVDRLAHHALRGGEWSKAVAYLRQAAARAATRSAHREAVAHLEQALVVLERLPEGRLRTEQAIDIRLDLRLSLLPLGELERILPYLREAEGLAEQLGDQHRLGRLSVYMTGQYYLRGDHDRALEYGGRAQAITEALRDFSLEVATNAYVGQIHLVRGDYRAATALFRKNVEVLVGDLTQERFGLPQLPAVHSRFCLVVSLAELGEFAEGVVRGRESIHIAESIEQPLNLTVAVSGLGRLYLRKGDLELAIPILERGVELSRTWNLGLWFPPVASALGSAYAVAGRSADALPLLKESVERTAAMRLLSAQSPALTALGEALVLAGRPGEALEPARQALALAQQNGERGHEAWALRLLGEIELRSDPAGGGQAHEWFLRALERAADLGMRPLAAHCHLGLGQAVRLSGASRESDEHCATAAGLMREMDMRPWQARTEWGGGNPLR